MVMIEAYGTPQDHFMKLVDRRSNKESSTQKTEIEREREGYTK